MEELIKTSVSMPCHKYMIRAILTEDDKLSYARAFIAKLYETGHSIDDIMTCYAATGAFRTKQDFFFLSYRGENLTPEEFYQAIQKDSSIPHYKSCREYLKTHPQNISAICRTCPSYTGYTNRNKKTELAILKFVSSSKANLDYFLTLSDAKYYRSCYDLAENMISGVPFIVPLPRLCFSTILKCGPEYYEQNLLALTEEDRLNSLQSRIISILKSRYNADTVFPDYVRIFPTIWKIFVHEISESETLSKSDVKGFIEYTSILDHASGRKTRPRPEQNQSSAEKVSLSDAADKVKEELTLKASQAGPALWDNNNLFPGRAASITEPAPSLGGQPAQEQLTKNSSESPGIEEAALPGEKASPENNLQPAVQAPVKTDALTSGLSGASLDTPDRTPTPDRIDPVGDANTGVSVNTPVQDNACQDMQNPEENPATNTDNRQQTAGTVPASSDASITLSPIRINDIALPVIKQQDLRKYCCLVTDENADFVTVSVARDQMMSLECLQDENGTHILLIWIPIYHKFYYGEFACLHRRLKEILVYKSICKVCYQPYYLYSLSKLYAVPARNVYSIFSAHIAITGFNVSMTYQDIIEMYTCGKRFEQMVENVPVLNNFIGGLPLYETIYRNLKQIVDKAPSLQKKIARSFLLDEVNGTSYMRCINFMDSDLLFTFCKDGTIQYNDNYVKKVKRNGALVTYVIENTDYTRTARRNVYETLLADLAKAGRIRKLNIQLVMLTGDILMLFIGANGFELLDTTIKIMFSKFATDNGIDSFHILVSREWLLADQTIESSHLEDYAAEEDDED